MRFDRQKTFFLSSRRRRVLFRRAFLFFPSACAVLSSPLSPISGRPSFFPMGEKRIFFFPSLHGVAPSFLARSLSSYFFSLFSSKAISPLLIQTFFPRAREGFQRGNHRNSLSLPHFFPPPGDRRFSEAFFFFPFPVGRQCFRIKASFRYSLFLLFC